MDEHDGYAPHSHEVRADHLGAGPGRTSPGHLTLIAGAAVPGTEALLAQAAGGGHEPRYAGPGSDPRAAAAVLYHTAAQVPDGPLRAPGIPPGLSAQATARLQEILPAAGITGEPGPRQMGGHGLRSVLPVLAALLPAPPGGTVLLEHPETGLHPAGQATAGRLACLAAAAGRNVTVATHSDHVLNSMRIAVADRVLPAASVTIRHYRPVPGGAVTADTITVGPDGMLSHWPPGFFDQWDHDLEQLARSGHPRHPDAGLLPGDGREL